MIGNYQPDSETPEVGRAMRALVAAGMRRVSFGLEGLDTPAKLIVATELTARTETDPLREEVRDVAKALGLPGDQLEQLSRVFGWWDGEEDLGERLRERGFDPDSPVLRRILRVTRELLDAPRHLSQHTGGFVISRGPLDELVFGVGVLHSSGCLDPELTGKQPRQEQPPRA